MAHNLSFMCDTNSQKQRVNRMVQSFDWRFKILELGQDYCGAAGG
jgi:hypothetical protein